MDTHTELFEQGSSLLDFSEQDQGQYDGQEGSCCVLSSPRPGKMLTRRWCASSDERKHKG